MSFNLGSRGVVPCTAMILSPRDFSFALLPFLWLSSSGCGLEYGKDGFIDRSVAADVREQVRMETCTDGQQWLDHDPLISDCADQDPRHRCHPGCYVPRT